MRNFFSTLVTKVVFRNYTLIIILFSSIAWFFAFEIYANTKNQQIILHYNVKIGADQIGSASNIFILPAIGFTILVLNLIIAYKSSKLTNANAHLLLFTSLLINLLIVASLYSIYLINLIDF